MGRQSLRIPGSRHCDRKARELWRGLRFQVLGTVVDASHIPFPMPVEGLSLLLG